MGTIFHVDKPEFPNADKKLFEKPTDNHKEIYSEYLAHSEQIHSARNIYPIIFFVLLI
jgi:hypothetical protein